MVYNLEENNRLIQNNSIEQLLAVKKRNLEMLSDPLSTNKEEIIKAIKKIDKKLIKLNQIPYFCNKCHYSHKSGQIYHDHKKFAEIRFEFPEIKTYKVFHNFKTRLVGIYKLKTSELIKELPSYMNLQLKSEIALINQPINISVYYGDKKVGYLYKKNQKFSRIVKAVRENHDYNCYFLKYIPKKARKYKISRFNDGEEEIVEYECWDAEYAEVEIEIFDKKLFWQVLQGLKELIELGHRKLKPAFKKLGPRALKYLEPENKYYKKIIRFLEQFQKISSNSESLGIML